MTQAEEKQDLFSVRSCCDQMPIVSPAWTLNALPDRRLCSPIRESQDGIGNRINPTSLPLPLNTAVCVFTPMPQQPCDFRCSYVSASRKGCNKEMIDSCSETEHQPHDVRSRSTAVSLCTTDSSWGGVAWRSSCPKSKLPLPGLSPRAVLSFVKQVKTVPVLQVLERKKVLSTIICSGGEGGGGGGRREGRLLPSVPADGTWLLPKGPSPKAVRRRHLQVDG